MKIKSKQLEDTLGSLSSPFTAIHSSEFVGDLSGAIKFEAKNTSGNTISKGKAVYVTGVSGDTKPIISLALSNSSETMPAFGVAYADIANNATGEVVTFGNLLNVNTSSFSEGDDLFISSTSPGTLTNVPPTTSSNLIQNLGKVIRSHATSGSIKVGGAGRTNATPNLDQGKFFVGNASNQSSQSAYSLPLLDGDDGQVLSTDGQGQLSFSTPSSGSSITTQRINSWSITAQKDYRYIIDINSLAATINITLPASPSTGDTIYFLPRYNNRVSFSSAGTEIITRVGFNTEPYTEDFNLNEGIEIKSIYSGTEWVIESPTKELYNWTSTTLNETVFIRYETILCAFGTSTFSLPNQENIPDGTALKIHFTTRNATPNSTSASSYPNVVTLNSYNGNNEVALLGATTWNTPTSSVSLRTPRTLTIYKYNSYFIVVSDNMLPLGHIDKNNLVFNVRGSSSSINALPNRHYYLTTGNDVNVTLPLISDLYIGDEIFFSKASGATPSSFTISLHATDAANSSIHLNSPGLVEVDNSNIDSLSLPLSGGTVHVKKMYDVSGFQHYDVRLIQSDEGSTLTVSDTAKTLLSGFNYEIDTNAAGGTVTLTLPYNDYDVVNYNNSIKVVDDTYDVIIKTYTTVSYIDGVYNSINPILFKAGNSKNRCITIRPTDRLAYKIVSDTQVNSSNYIEELTSTTTLSPPAYGVASETYTINHATNAITINLPAIASVPSGFKYNFKRIGAGTVSIDPNSTEYIDYTGQTQVSISNQYDNLILQNTGSFWIKL